MYLSATAEKQADDRFYHSQVMLDFLEAEDTYFVGMCAL